nr:MAG TPA_asm: hypothetical protein [Caudoviricetes sp.]
MQVLISSFLQKEVQQLLIFIIEVPIFIALYSSDSYWRPVCF